MRKTYFLVLAAALRTLVTSPAWGDAGGPGAESVPELPESVAQGPTNYGEIIFFPETESRPSEDRHSVQAGQEVTVCIRLSENASSYIEQRRKDTIGFRLILEDSEDPPHRLNLTLGNRLQRMKPNAEGCYGGAWKIPAVSAPGVYQVSDLLWADNDQSYYSLRNYLFEFSRVEELDVQNPDYDKEPPKLVELRSFGKNPQPIQYYGGVLRARVEQIFRFEDAGKGVDEKSLRVFYKLSVDGQEMGPKEAKCSKRQGKYVLKCKLQMNNPEILWALAHVNLTLSGLSIRDNAGNWLRLDGEEAFQQAVPGAQLSFDYERRKKWPAKRERELSLDAVR